MVGLRVVGGVARVLFVRCLCKFGNVHFGPKLALSLRPETRLLKLTKGRVHLALDVREVLPEQHIQWIRDLLQVRQRRQLSPVRR